MLEEGEVLVLLPVPPGEACQELVEETRQPGNDVGYLLVVFFTWLLLFKAVMLAVSIANRFGARGVTLEAGSQKKVDRKLLGGPKAG